MNGRKLKKPPISIIFIIAIFVAITYAIIVTINDNEYTDYPGYINAMQGAAAPVITPFVPIITPPFTEGIHVTEITDTHHLKLVSRDFPITTTLCYSLLREVWPDLAASSAYVRLRETAFNAMRDLFSEVDVGEIGTLFIASGYRCYYEQSVLYANAPNPEYVKPAGHSEHQLGLAVDILSGDNYYSMRGTEEARWLRENAPRFGLILRYPEHKQDITGVPYEPWHFRYVGRVHAWYMGEHDFVLEEYIEYLRDSGVVQTEFDGRNYYIYYQLPQNGMVFFPEHLSFMISSTNTGGFIVTAWR